MLSQIFTRPLARSRGAGALLAGERATEVDRSLDGPMPSLTPLPAVSSAPAARFDDVSLVYPNGTHALESVSFSVHQGEFVSLLGPSGSGKSTLLRLLAGFETPTRGAVHTNRQSLGYVFQDATLLPWRSVLANVELPARLAGGKLDHCRQRALAAIARVGLNGFEQHKPAQLSGGMRMRTSIARMLTVNPSVFLFDEPFGALDDITRDSLNQQLVEMFASDPFAGLFVTHSVRESVFLSTRVIVLSPRPGRICAEIPVPFGYPRAAELAYTSEFAEVTGRVARALREASR
jgi:NitT/TauT family transport system ATP-binding protein